MAKCWESEEQRDPVTEDRLKVSLFDTGPERPPVGWLLPSPSGSRVWIISWKMVFLSEVLWRDAELPPLCRAGRTCRTSALPLNP